MRAQFSDNGTVRFELASEPGKFLRVTELGRVGKSKIYWSIDSNYRDFNYIMAEFSALFDESSLFIMEPVSGGMMHLLCM